jgi:hypothetical protein
MEAICSSEMSVAFQCTTWRYITEDRTLHNHSCENLKSYNFYSWSRRVKEIFCFVGIDYGHYHSLLPIEEKGKLDVFDGLFLN